MPSVDCQQQFLSLVWGEVHILAWDDSGHSMQSGSERLVSTKAEALVSSLVRCGIASCFVMNPHSDASEASGIRRNVHQMVIVTTSGYSTYFFSSGLLRSQFYFNILCYCSSVSYGPTEEAVLLALDLISMG